MVKLTLAINVFPQFTNIIYCYVYKQRNPINAYQLLQRKRHNNFEDDVLHRVNYLYFPENPKRCKRVRRVLPPSLITYINEILGMSPCTPYR